MNISETLNRITQALHKDVVRIRYNIEEDWSGSPAIFFRVVLTNEASKSNQLLEVSRRVKAKIEDEVKLSDLGLQFYFNFRSESEQKQLKENDWDEQ